MGPEDWRAELNPSAAALLRRLGKRCRALAKLLALPCCMMGSPYPVTGSVTGWGEPIAGSEKAAAMLPKLSPCGSYKYYQ